MQIGLSTLSQIGTNYYIPLNEKEILVVEDDSRSKKEESEVKKLQKEEKKAQEKQEKQNPQELSEDEKRLVKELQARDSEVKAHEAAHQAAGGGNTGPASFSYQQGPDGKMYAIGGEVSISIKGGATPQEQIANARAIITAAMAPANPSSQDFAVANSAKMMEMKAQQKLAKEQQQKNLAKESYTEMNDISKTQNSLDISA
ncbi:MAG: putative metalloprotease CJM1_0395 family protein [Sulfurimonas sp.]